MSKCLCECGRTLSNVHSPSGLENYLLSDFQMEDFNDKDGKKEIYNLAISVWKCSECKRLTLFDELGRVNQVYTLEKENTYHE